VAKPVMQSTTAPLISGIASAAKTAMEFDWSKFNNIGGQTSAFTGTPKPSTVSYGGVKYPTTFAGFQ
jgi:hypothetical protein